jgi:predicted metal-dependent hydrolase
MFINIIDDLLGGGRRKTKRNPLGWRKPPVKIEPETFIWEVGGRAIPVELLREPKRTNWRYSFGKGNVLRVRIPKLSIGEEENLLAEIKRRFVERMEQKPDLYSFFNPKKYVNGTVVEVDERTYRLKIFIEKRDNCVGKLKIEDGEKVIDMRVDAYMDETARQKAIGKIICRIVSADALPHFSRRVDAYNDRFFQKDIRNIRFKNNHSNWGSCSSKGNLNFSSRLLFAPRKVQDYVIVHELAHLVEMNHSDRFWEVVASVMPDYEEQERWLKLHTADCQF